MWWQFSESVVSFSPWRPALPRNNRAGFDVAMNLKMSTQTAECEFDLFLLLSWTGVLARASPHLYLDGLQRKVDCLVAAVTRASVCSC